MVLNSLDGRTFYSLIQQGSLNLKRNIEIVNDLNVFPIPDGDTGTNMSWTLDGGLTPFNGDISKVPTSLSDFGKQVSRGMLFAARGNSGVILSQIFRGICKGFNDLEKANAFDVANAFISGIKQAYSSVKTPVEGTILTVFREASEFSKSHLNKKSSINDYFTLHLQQARLSLERTIDLLPVLKENDVIDSGGAGYVYIIEGFIDYLNGVSYNDIKSTPNSGDKKEIDFSAFSSDDRLEFGYCTEFIMRLQKAKVPDIEHFDVARIINDLEEDDIKGESIVVFKEDDVIKAHVHTLEPGLVLYKMRRYGEFLTTKIENMNLQHNQILKEGKKNKIEHKKYAIVAVSDGEGISNAFKELGADIIINGGQTMNPSAEDFVNAYDKLDAEHIFVFPNNSNIKLAAKQSTSLYEDKDTQIHVIDCYSIPACYSALTMIDFSSDDLEVITDNFSSTINNVTSGEVAHAIRDRVNNGIIIHKNDYLGIIDGEIVSSGVDENEVVVSLLRQVDDIDDKEVLTIIYGNDVKEEEYNVLINKINEVFPNLECVPVNGQQVIYRYYLAIE